MLIIRKRAYARAGLLGNPSDGYNGKTISVIVRNFWAEVVLYEWDSVDIVLAEQDRALVDPFELLRTGRNNPIVYLELFDRRRTQDATIIQWEGRRYCILPIVRNLVLLVSSQARNGQSAAGGKHNSPWAKRLGLSDTQHAVSIVGGAAIARAHRPGRVPPMDIHPVRTSFGSVHAKVPRAVGKCSLDSYLCL